jgi:hypothetical protein
MVVLFPRAKQTRQFNALKKRLPSDVDRIPLGKMTEQEDLRGVGGKDDRVLATM